MRFQQILRNDRFAHLQVAIIYALFYFVLFSPAWLNGFLLAPEDSFFDYAPRFCVGFSAWTDLIFGGFPLRSDPQQATFYPLRLLFCSLGSWNGYVISAYILASFFTYMFVFEQTQNRRGAILAGFVFAASGYLLRFVHMQSLVQAIIWFPLILWALERLRRGFSSGAMAIGALAIAMSCFGGHPQMFFYSVATSVLYAFYIILCSTRDCRLLAVRIVALFVLGLALAAPQWMSTLDYIRYTGRAALDYASFTLNSWQPVEWTRLFVPSVFSLLNIDVWQGPTACPIRTLHEEHVSTGLLALVLAVAGGIAYRRRPFVWFWVGISVFSLLLAFGSTTFFGDIAYHLPGYNLFRVPSRHMVFFVMAVCVLAAHFYQYLEEYPTKAFRTALLASLFVGFFYVMAMGLLLVDNCLSSMSPVLILSIGLAILVLCAVPAAAFLWPRVKARGRTILFLVLLAVCLVELVQGGWFRFGFVPSFPWPTPVAMNPNKHELLSLPRPSDLEAPPHVEWIKQSVGQNHTRMWSSRGKMSGRAGLLNNVSIGWGLPNIGGYSPLAPTPILDVMAMIYGGTALSDWWRPNNQALNIASVEYVTVPTADDNLLTLGGKLFASMPFRQSLSPEKKEVTYRVVHPSPLKEINLDSVLTDMSGVFLSGASPDGTLVATMTAYDGAREVQSWSLRYGQVVRHVAAHCSLAQSVAQEDLTFAPLGIEVMLDGQRCALMQYIWKGKFEQVSKIDRLVLTYHAPIQSQYRVLRLSLIDEAGQTLPIVESLQELDSNPSYERVATVDNAHIYRNKAVRPRAYFVQEVLGGLSYQEVLQAIHTGYLSTGSVFDGQKQALTETGRGRRYDSRCTALPITWLKDSPLEIRLRTITPAACFLVLADGYYKNWHVLVNGQQALLKKTNAAFRGVEVPEGSNEITFVYEPSLMNKIGDGVGLGALLMLAILLGYGPTRLWRGGKFPDVDSDRDMCGM